jgi:hypothetical protein
MNRRATIRIAEPAAKDTAAPLDVARLLTAITDNLVGMIYRRRPDAIWTLEFVSGGCPKRAEFVRLVQEQGAV